jgi:transcriptional antiterminator RfaH
MGLAQQTNWYALHTKPCREDVAAMNVRRLGLEVFLPKICEKRIVFGVQRKLIVPLFRNYLFARFCPDTYLHLIRYARGVQSVVSCGEIPLIVDEQIIKAILSRIGKNGYVRLRPKSFRPGDMVTIQEGPFEGFNGIFERELSGQERVIILLDSILYQAHVSVEKQHLKTAVETL